MTTFGDLEQANPNIRSQYDAWRQARADNGEDAAEWVSFRLHVLALGAPDPGEEEAEDFVGDDYKAAHPERYGQR